MLTYLEIENFGSIRDKIRLNLKVPKTAPDDPRFLRCETFPEIRVPAVIAILGANASGKTTILRALAFVENFVLNSFDLFKPDDPISVDSFRRSEFENKSTKIKVEFVPRDQKDSKTKTILIRYEINIKHNEFRRNFVSLERLSGSADGKNFLTIFSLKRRTAGSKPVIETSPVFELEEDDPRRNVRNNVSLLSSLRQFDHDQAKRFSYIFDQAFISNLYYSKMDKDEQFSTKFYADDEQNLSKLRYRIQTIDVGVEDVSIESLDGKKVVFFHHKGLDSPHPLFFESDGTKSFFHIFPSITQSLDFGSIAVLDELDSDLHPQLVAEIMSWYLRADENKLRAQLITSCNSASVLRILEKEEVWIAEKSGEGVTTVIPLSSLKGVRRDTNLYSRYLSGEFGGVPYFG